MSKSRQLSDLERYQIIRPFLDSGISLPIIATQHNLHLRTLRRWVQQYKENGIQGLKRKIRKDKNVRSQLSEEQQQIVEALILQKPPLSLTAIHKSYEKIAKIKEWAVPSYYTIRDIAQKMDKGLLTLAHLGNKVYDQAFELLHRQEATQSNEIWQADHTPLDIVIKDNQGKARKPWLTIIIDDYSRAISGFFLSFDAPCAFHTALALRQAIWRKTNSKWMVCGIPQILYTDHGSDFTSRHIEAVCADLKTRLIFSTVGKPRGRGKVERFFLSINQLLLMNLSGYAPSGSTTVQATLSLEEMNGLLEEFIVEKYHHRTHGTTKKKPLKQWTGAGFLPQMPDSLEQLDLLLLTVSKLRKVRRDGIFFKNFRYIDTNLAAYVGESVVVRYDPRDLAQISVFHKEKFICRATCQELAGHTISLKEIIKARRSRKRELRQIINRGQVLLNDVIQERQSEKLSKTTSSLKKYSND